MDHVILCCFIAHVQCTSWLGLHGISVFLWLRPVGLCLRASDKHDELLFEPSVTLTLCQLLQVLISVFLELLCHLLGGHESQVISNVRLVAERMLYSFSCFSCHCLLIGQKYMPLSFCCILL